MKAKVFFFGVDQYSQIVLKALQKSPELTILKVVSPAEMNQLPALIKQKKPQVGILASFGAILPQKIIDSFPRGILNLHPSLLPKYRGPSPVQTAILNGDQETGLTIIKMDEEVDHGPIVAQFREKIKPDDTAATLYRRLFRAGAEILKTILPAYLEGRIKLRQQNHAQATFTQKLSRADGKINWRKTDPEIERQIRAFHPWPGTWTLIKEAGRPAPQRLKILAAHLEKGKLIFDQVQLEGKKPVSWKQFCEGHPEAKISRSS